MEKLVIYKIGELLIFNNKGNFKFKAFVMLTVLMYAMIEFSADFLHFWCSDPERRQVIRE